MEETKRKKRKMRKASGNDDGNEEAKDLSGPEVVSKIAKPEEEEEEILASSKVREKTRADELDVVCLSIAQLVCLLVGWFVT